MHIEPPAVFSPLHIMERITQLPYRVLFGLWMLMVLSFGLFYFALNSLGSGLHGVTSLSEIPDPLTRLGNSVYFSIITATTVGYGDLVPLGFAKVIAATEAIFGFFLYAIFVGKLVSHKHEHALRNVHKLSFQNTFFKIQEGFYLMRRDCDAIAAEAQSHHSLSPRAWNNLRTMYQRGQTLMDAILDFYEDFDWYAIDAIREALLLDAVDRTLQHLLVTLHAHIPDGKHSECREERINFINKTTTVMRRWQEVSTHDHAELFAKIVHTIEELKSAA